MSIILLLRTRNTLLEDTVTRIVDARPILARGEEPFETLEGGDCGVVFTPTS
jgi:hypothetical protein